ncbi:MAG: hypothetical protein IT169_15335 [Bryobacterales bacterium]|nr:hypothetical protein [Bryobacterales bacterium]
MRRAAIAALIERERWQVVDSAAWEVLRNAFSTVSESTLRHDLLASGFPLQPMVEGVRFDTLEELARSLTALAECERRAAETARNGMISPARKCVLEARRKAEAVLRNPSVSAEKHEAMEEKFLWLRTWLENPELFVDWAPLRLRQIRNRRDGSPHPML